MAEFSEGNVVDTPDGWGVVTGVMTEAFDWPTGDEETQEVDASSDSPEYVVALGDGGSNVYSEDDLSEQSEEDAFGDEDVEPGTLADEAEMAAVYGRVNDPFDFDGFERAVEEMANVPGVDDPEVGFSSLPDGWTRKSVLQAWASLGGTFRTCRADMAGEIRSPTRWCAALKDEVLGTERWRNRF